MKEVLICMYCGNKQSGKHLAGLKCNKCGKPAYVKYENVSKSDKIIRWIKKRLYKR